MPTRDVSNAEVQLTLVDSPVAAERANTGASHRRLASFRGLSHWARFHCHAIARRAGMRPGDDLFVFAQAAKLTEEIGELNAELLGRQRLQRADKGVRSSDKGLRDELADVVICCAILAEALQIDISGAIQAKMATVDRRYQEQSRVAASSG